MIVSRTTNRRAARTRFLLIYGATLACAAVVVIALSHRAPPPPKVVTVREAAPTAASGFALLTRLEQEYTRLIDKGRYGELADADTRLALCLDSLQRRGDQIPAVAYGREVLALHRRAAAHLEPKTAPSEPSPDPLIAALQSQLKEKDRRIAQLESSNKGNEQAVPASYQYRAAKGETIEALKQSNMNLQLGFRDIMNKLWASYRSYNLLKKENDALRRQVAELRR